MEAGSAKDEALDNLRARVRRFARRQEAEARRATRLRTRGRHGGHGDRPVSRRFSGSRSRSDNEDDYDDLALASTGSMGTRLLAAISRLGRRVGHRLDTVEDRLAALEAGFSGGVPAGDRRRGEGPLERQQPSGRPGLLTSDASSREHLTTGIKGER